MATKEFCLTLYMVSSLDGLIAKRDNSVGWFETTDHYEKGADGSQNKEDHSTADCYVMGSKTYEHALELSKSYGWVYGDVPTIVVTGRKLPIERSTVETYDGDLTELVARLSKKYHSVWVVGGAALARSFLQKDLVDVIRMPVLPIILGEGVPFFDNIGKEIPLHVEDVVAYKNGMVELVYQVRK